MSKIKKLEKNIINNIAAGEIVEGPSSVVKELIENSIDAQSSSINVYIKKSGLKSIVIQDNGCGIASNDLKVAFERHTTSKISSKKDLMNINTLGFRGEALPSIASVSMLKAISKPENSKKAYEIEIDGGDEKSFKIGVLENSGTFISVENLFYNIPARMKFIKSEKRELNKITDIVKSYSLCYPSISFRYFHDNKPVFELKENTLKGRILDIFGKQYSKSLLKVEYSQEGYSITGFTGNIDLLRKRKTNQFMFLNDRLIRDNSIDKAIRRPYFSASDRGEHPFYVLNLKVPNESVDVNVHPNKNEVRFKNDQHLYHLVKRSISESVKDVLNTMPTFYKDNQHDALDNVDILDFRKDLIKEIPENIQKHFVNYESIDKETTDDKNTDNFQDDDYLEQNDSNLLYTINDVWQIHNKYILTEINQGLLIIDQHVAHERVLYEIAKSDVDKNGVKSQSLLFPQYLDFQKDEYNYIVEIFPYLNKLGFRLREFGENTIIIESSPVETPFGTETDIIREILDIYIKYSEINSSFIDKMCATYACKAAIKAGEKLEVQEIKHLINRLFMTKNPYFCPHGRPIIINLTEEELDERFERK